MRRRARFDAAAFGADGAGLDGRKPGGARERKGPKSDAPEAALEGSCALPVCVKINWNCAMTKGQSGLPLLKNRGVRPVRLLPRFWKGYPEFPWLIDALGQWQLALGAAFALDPVLVER